MPNVGTDEWKATVQCSKELALQHGIPWPFEDDYVEGTCEFCNLPLEPKDWMPGISGVNAHIECLALEGITFPAREG